jgi:hypothetical protein
VTTRISRTSPRRMKTTVNGRHGYAVSGTPTAWQKSQCGSRGMGKDDVERQCHDAILLMDTADTGRGPPEAPGSTGPGTPQAVPDTVASGIAR